MLLLFSGVLIVLLFFGVQLKVPTAFAVPAFSSSNATAPATNTCATIGCHSGTATAGGSAVVIFPGTTYTPGVTQHLSVKVTDPTSTNTAFGYILTARLASSVSSQAGTFTATDANSAPAPNTGNASIVEMKAMTFASSTWSFDWTPPATASGTVNFYLTGVAFNPLTFSVIGNGIYQSMGTLTAAAPTVAPSITSASSTTFTVGTAGTFTVTATGTPAPTLSETGSLPAGVTFNTTTHVLSGTPTVSGTFPITFTATNSTLPNATQSFTLTVNPAPIVGVAPAITSLISTTFTVGTAGTFTVTATGTPAPTLSETGSLPAGVTFNTTTHVLSGTPTVSGTFPITFTATNGTLPNAMQSFTLTVNPAPSTNTGALAVSPSSLTFHYRMGGSWPSSRTLAITSSGGSTSYTAKETDPWLSINPVSGSGTPGSMQASVNPAGMAPGSYGAQINITAQSGKTTTVPVALTITGGDGEGGTPGGMFAKPYMSDPQSGALAAAWVENLGASPLSTTDPRNRGLALAESASASAGTWAGAVIQNVTGISLTELGFDFRASIQCSTNSIQFVVITTDGVKHTVGGCTSSPTTPPSSAPAGWMRLRFDPSQATPTPISKTDQVQSISIELDKGSTSTGSIAVIDNIEINGVPVGKWATLTSRDD